MRRAWLGIATVVAAVVAAALFAARPPSPRAADAPPEAFSEERAWPVFLHLTRTLGSRATGTAQWRPAAAYLVEKLRELPGVEVELQEGPGVVQRGWTVESTQYSALNVLARIPGRRQEAILLTAHYDSALEGAGAGDDGLAAAALVEIARALTAGPQLERTVILNLSGAEELWIAGAPRFLEHPWSRYVSAFVNLDSMGTRGRLLLFRVTADDLGLVDSYRWAARILTVLASRRICSRRVSSPAAPSSPSTPSKGSCTGSIALYEDGYAYHTSLDTADRVERGTMKDIGETALAVTRELAKNPNDRRSEIGSYYDFREGSRSRRQRAMVEYSMALALLAAVGAIGTVLRRDSGNRWAVLRAAGLRAGGGGQPAVPRRWGLGCWCCWLACLVSASALLAGCASGTGRSRASCARRQVPARCMGGAEREGELARGDAGPLLGSARGVGETGRALWAVAKGMGISHSPRRRVVAGALQLIDEWPPWLLTAHGRAASSGFCPGSTAHRAAGRHAVAARRHRHGGAERPAASNIPSDFVIALWRRFPRARPHLRRPCLGPCSLHSGCSLAGAMWCVAHGGGGGHGHGCLQRCVASAAPGGAAGRGGAQHGLCVLRRWRPGPARATRAWPEHSVPEAASGDGLGQAQPLEQDADMSPGHPRELDYVSGRSVSKPEAPRSPS